jgi:hypothetical protein
MFHPSRTYYLPVYGCIFPAIATVTAQFGWLINTHRSFFLISPKFHECRPHSSPLSLLLLLGGDFQRNPEPISNNFFE